MTDKVKQIIAALRAGCAEECSCADCPLLEWCHTDEVLLNKDAADLIESLAAELEQVKQERDGLNIMLAQAQSMLETRTRERDAALEDLRDACLCRTCAHEAYCAGSIDGCEGCRKRRGCPCRAGRPDCNWQWRGVEV